VASLFGELAFFTIAVHHGKMARKKESQSLETAGEIRKANQVIAPRVTRGGILTLLSRKVFNVLLYHTQRQKTPGAGAPEGDDVYSSLYWLPMSELARDARYGSGDMELLKDTLVKLQDIRITTDDSKGFASDVLIASVRIVPGKRGTATMLGWGLHAATEKILRAPEFYTRLSLYYLTSLKTTGGIALYENTKRYATNPSGLTRREPWEWWYEVLTGLPITSEKPEYKYFKRDVLKPAIAEANSTDIRVELLEHREGRRVTYIQFQVEHAKQQQLELPAPPIIDSELLSKLGGFGIHSREAEDLMASTEDKLLRATVNWVEVRMADKKLPPVISPASLFRSALRGRYTEGQLLAIESKTRMAAEQTQKTPAKSAQVSAEEQGRTDAVTARVQAALQRYDALSEEEQDSVNADFRRANPALVRVKTGGAAFRKSLGSFLAKIA